MCRYENKCKCLCSIKTVKFKEVCVLLGISRTGLNNLILRDPTFPKRIKNGEARQAGVSFAYEDLITWINEKKSKK